MKYIDADKLLSEINARIERCEKDEEDGYPDTTSSEATLKSVRTFITSLQQEQPSLPSNLDEAAEKYAEHYHDKMAVVKGFKAGAEWMAGQGESIVAKIGLSTEEICCTISEETLDSLGVQADDEIIIQIRKKQ